MLSFLKELLSRHQLNVFTVDLNDISKHTNPLFNDNALIGEIVPHVEKNVLYKFTDSFFRSFYFLSYPTQDVYQILCIGPYLKREISVQEILEICESKNIEPKQHKYLVEYYSGLPVLQDNDALISAIVVFCERIWNTRMFVIKDITDKYANQGAPFTLSTIIDDKDSGIQKTAIERRYAFENEMLRAVSLGQLHLENQFRSAFSSNFFEMRANTPLRNAKNYAIIMNTLLRKGAEQGGVHPIYLDKLSSSFAIKIENISTIAENSAIMGEMFQEYCRLVRKHTLQKYSPIVQKTILLIDTDLSVDLSPKRLAKLQNVTLGYLSTVFKKDTGKTLSAYICERRMEYAAYLLRTTNLQIQTIALYCGIVDAQYFSKLFKKHYEKTPLEYRKKPR